MSRYSGSSSSPSSSSNVLADVSTNHHRLSQRPQGLKYPPGLGMESSPSPVHDEPTTRQTRRRSGSFTYTSGSSFSTGNLSPSRANGLTRPAKNISSLGKRSAATAGLSRSTYALPEFQSHSLPPPPRSPQGSKFSECFSTPKFDPFTSDEPSAPLASSTVYNHYWQYDPSTNGPKLRSYVSPSPQRLSNTPQTVKIPALPTVSLSSSRPSSYYTPSFLPRSPPSDKNARAKVVAGILLNRIYVVGKPMRRGACMAPGLEKAYVKSGLSSVISIEC